MKRQLQRLVILFFAGVLSLAAGDVLSRENTEQEFEERTCLTDISGDLERKDLTEFQYALSRCASRLSAKDPQFTNLFVQHLENIHRELGLKGAESRITLESDAERRQLIKDVVFYLGLAYQYSNQFKEAARRFRQYKYLASDHELTVRDIDNRLKKVTGRAQWDTLLDSSSFIISQHNRIYLFAGFATLLLLFIMQPIEDRLYKKSKTASPQDETPDDQTRPGILRSCITVEEICETDGRVSVVTCNKLEEAIKHGKDHHLDGCGYKRARSLIRAQAMIQRVNQMAPWGLYLIAKLFRRKSKVPSYPQILLISALFCAIWSGIALFHADSVMHMRTPKDTIVMSLFIVALLCAGLTAVRIMAERTVQSLDELVSMLDLLDTEKMKATLANIEKDMWSLFRSPWQVLIAMVVFFGTSIFIPTCLNKNFYAFDAFFIAILILALSPVTWFVIKSIFIVDRICTIPSLAINPLSPIKTLGLEQWISLIGTYAVCAGLVTAFGCALPVIYTFFEGSYSTAAWAWVVLLPFLAFYWLYPFQRLGALVRNMKNKRLNLFKNKMTWFYRHWVYSENQLLRQTESCDMDNAELVKLHTKELNRLKDDIGALYKYKEMFDSISTSPASYFDMGSFLKLLQALGIPSLFALFSAFFL